MTSFIKSSLQYIQIPSNKTQLLSNSSLTIKLQLQLSLTSARVIFKYGQENIEIMASRHSEIIQLIDDSDKFKLEKIKTLLRNNYDLYYIHETHRLCPRVVNWREEKPEHWVLVIFSSKYYLKLMALVIGINAEIPEHEIDDDTRYDTTAMNIGRCICGTISYVALEQYNLKKNTMMLAKK